MPAGCPPLSGCRTCLPGSIAVEPALPRASRPSPNGQLPCALLQCGYLYLSEPDRLHEMMGLLGLGDAPPPDSGSSGNGSSRGSGGGGSLDASG